MTDSYGTFDPVKTEDYAAPLLESYRDINQGMDNYWGQELQNYKYKAQDAGIKDLEALTNLSSAIGKRIDEQIKKRREEQITKGMLWLKENPLDVLTTERFEAEIARLKEEGRSVDEFVAQYESSEGSDIWTSESFRELNSAQKYGAVVEWAEGKVRDYDPSNNEKLQNAVTAEEYKAAEYAASVQLYKTIGALNPALVQKHVISKQKELEAAAFSKWNQKRTQEIKAERQKIARSQLISCHANGQGGCQKDYLNKRAPLVGNSAAKKELMAQYLVMAKDGTLTSNVIQDLETKNKDNEIVSSADGKTYAWNEFFAEDWVKIKQAAIDTEARNMERAQQEKNTKAMQEIPVKLKEILGDNFDVVEGLNQEQLAQIRNYQSGLAAKGVTGNPLTVLNNMLKFNDADKNLLANEKAKALKMAKEGTLNSETLKEFSQLAQIDSEITRLAKLGDDSNTLKKENHKAIGKLIDTEPTSDGEGAKPTEIKVIGEYRRQYDALVRQYKKIPNITNPEDQAFETIRKEIAAVVEADLSGNSTDKYVSGAWKWGPTINYAPNSVNAQLSEGTKIVSYVNELIEETNDDSILDTHQLFAPNILKSFNKKGTKPHRLAHQLAKSFAQKNIKDAEGNVITAYDIMERQGKLYGADKHNIWKTADHPTYITAFKTLSKEAQELCTKEGNSINCTARALSTTGVDNTDWIPNNEGEQLKSFAESNGTTFGEYAAALELIPLLNIDFNNEDPFSKMDDFEWNHYWKSVYKYSGGQDKNALNNLILPDMKFILEESNENEEEVVEEDPRPTWSSKKYKNYNEFRKDVLAWRERNFQKENEEEIENYQNKINHLDPKNRNVPIK